MTFIKRVYVKKRNGFDVKEEHLLKNISENLMIKGLEEIRLYNCYDIEDVSDEELNVIIRNILSEPNVDEVYKESIDNKDDEFVLGIQYLPGQYDVRADSAMQLINILIGKAVNVKSSKYYVFKGNITNEDKISIKKYLINPVDSTEIGLDKPNTLSINCDEPLDVKVIKGFIDMEDKDITNFKKE